MATRTNTNYIRGANKERKIVNEAKALGKIAFRSAGSHSPIDCMTIDYTSKVIELIQCKSTKKLRGGIEPSLKKKLEEQYKFLNGTYTVLFKAK